MTLFRRRQAPSDAVGVDLSSTELMQLKADLSLPANTISDIASKASSGHSHTPEQVGAAAAVHTHDPDAIGAPTIIRGFQDLSRAPGLALGVVDGAQRLANATALQTAIAQCASNSRVAELPPGRYEYTSTQTQDGNNVGLQLPQPLRGFVGAGAGLTDLVNFASNHPVLTIGDVGNTPGVIENANYRGFKVGHGSSQTGNTSAHGLLLGHIFFSDFDDIEVNPFMGGGHPYVGLQIGLIPTHFFFSNLLGTIKVRGGQQHIMKSVSNNTGCAWGNIYYGGGSFGNRVVTTGEAVYFASTGTSQGTCQQFNLEWCAPQAQRLLRCDSLGMDIGSANIEGNKLTGFNAALVLSVGSRMTFRYLRVLNTWIASADTSGMPRLFETYDSGAILVDQCDVRWDAAGAEATCNRSLRIADEADTSLVGRRPSIVLRDLTIGGAGLTGTVAVDASSPQAALGAGGYVRALRNYEWHRVRARSSGSEIEMGDADMTAYANHEHVTVKQTATLTATRKLILSDRYASAGNDGAASIRRAGDIVHAHRVGGGAFDLNVRDHTDTTTLFALTAAGQEGFAEWSGSAWGAV